jgi:phosphopantothenoylcysteine decarboxylase / phosphopantothenate---cysteine ligase
VNRNPDILAHVKDYRAQSGWPLVTVGFAAETSSVLAHGQAKLREKGLDLIAVNDVSQPDAGFAVDTNRVLVLGKGDFAEELPLASKSAVAEEILRLVVDRLGAGLVAEQGA